MGDYYTEDPSRLHQEPKKTLARAMHEYLEQQDLHIPRIFSTLSEARETDVPFLARTEHPLEYDGPSGLRQSFSSEVLATLGINSEALLRRYDVNHNQSSIELFCHHANISVDDFLRDAGFSFWERIPGLNRAVIPDSAIPKQYHIATRRSRGLAAYTVVENGKIAEHHGDALPTDVKSGLPRLIEDVEVVRHFPRLDKHHCGIVELQTFDSHNYFLQYHRTRDFVPATFELKEAPGAGYAEAMFVRGATPPDGLIVEATVIYARLYRSGFQVTIPQGEEASFGFGKETILYEIRPRERKVQILEVPGTIPMLELVAMGHVSRSLLFKPEVSVIMPKDSVVTPEQKRELYERARETGENQTVQLHVIADGRNAYVKKVD